jgi:hypothetical protein
MLLWIVINDHITIINDHIVMIILNDSWCVWIHDY